MAFAHRLQQNTQTVNSQRADGYSSDTADIVCKFQGDVERLGSRANYDALRAALKWARSQQTFTYADLQSVYLAHC